MSRRGLTATCCALFAAGCASLEQPFLAHFESEAPLVRECAEWYRAIDERVDAAGVRDAQDARIPGFPYLRVNRLLASLRGEARQNEHALHALAERMLALDLDARQYEIMNLPTAQLGELPGAGDRFGLRIALQRTRECGRLLREIDLAKPEARNALLERATVPDDYLLSSRIAGLYAFSSAAFSEGVRRHQEQTLAAFRREPSPPPGASVVRYAPPPALPPPRAQTATLLERAAFNPLGVPEPSASDLERLLAVYAPSFEIEVAGDYDRFGALRWWRDEPVPQVDASQVVVYGHPAWTRYRGKVLLQLVYTIWFPERPPLSGSDILAGILDGITWRVTLSPEGEPLLYDSIHPCGCYHMFFPTPRARPLAAPDKIEEWLFAPQSLPPIAEGERPLLRIASGSHFIERVSVVRGTDSLTRYEFRPYSELRSLQRSDSLRASVFGPDGLVPGTERPERLLFWPMGILSAGAMRQWGRHATAFVGRRHFDDADLLEKRFSLDLK